jgi:hypothetical protein
MAFRTRLNLPQEFIENHLWKLPPIGPLPEFAEIGKLFLAAKHCLRSLIFCTNESAKNIFSEIIFCKNLFY